MVLTGQRRQPAAAAGAGLAPAHIQVQPALPLQPALHAHCPHVCSTLASADDLQAAVCTALFEALSAPGNLVQGETKNRT